MKTKVLLTTFIGVPESISFLWPDLGLSTLAGQLCANAFPVKILDFNEIEFFCRCANADLAERIVASPNRKREAVLLDESRRSYLAKAEREILNRLVSEVQSFDCELLCIKPWLGDSLAIFLRVARALRKRFPKLRIALGGPSISSLGEALLPLLHSVDYVCFGDGEEAVVGLARSLEGTLDLSDVPNCYCRAPTKGHRFVAPRVRQAAVLPELKRPVYDARVYPGVERSKIPVFLIEDARGCPFACPFCAHPSIGNEKFRPNLVEKALGQMLALKQDFGARAFRFASSCPSSAFFNDMTESLLKMRERFFMGAFFHLSLTGKVDFQRMARAGFVSLLTGVESLNRASQRRFFRKPVSRAALVALGKSSSKEGIFVSQTFIYPQLDPECREFDSYLRSYPFDRANSSIIVLFPVLFPGTAWWSEPETYEIFAEDRTRYLRGLALGEVSTGVTPGYRIRIGRRRHAALLREFISVRRKISTSGITLNVSDELALMARATGCAPGQFHAQQDLAIRNLDPTLTRELFNRVRKRLAEAPGRKR